jgi:hypothetical protein
MTAPQVIASIAKQSRLSLSFRERVRVRGIEDRMTRPQYSLSFRERVRVRALWPHYP